MPEVAMVPTLVVCNAAYDAVKALELSLQLLGMYDLILLTIAPQEAHIYIMYVLNRDYGAIM
eukprot:COSAG01_NODE_2410_length_7747_cov_70.111140_5_plen_62_part_00